jgi:predicted RNA binding protein YcfA (HicA-like mRNA interferase family)
VTRREQLISKIRARPVEADDDVRALLELFGWEPGRESGSHVTFVKAGEFPITVPKVGGRTVKRTDLVQICERLGLDA